MNTTAITFEELLDHNRASTAQWKAWFKQNEAALPVPCTIYNSETVRGLLKHMFAVELRHSQRLRGEEVTAYDAISAGSLDELFAIHERAIENMRKFLATADDTTVEEVIALQTVSAGTLHASRRKLFVHVLLHSMRHWAQLATLLREHGFKTDWPKDFLMSEAMR